MKTYKSFLIGIIIFIGIISCNKDNLDNEDSFICNEYCVNSLYSSPDSIIVSLEKLNVIKNLFEINSIDYTNFQFVRHYIVGSDSSSQNVVCNQFVNNVKLLKPQIVFFFKSTGELKRVTGEIEEINLNSEPSMSMNCIVESFISQLSLDNLFDGTIEETKAGCFDAEFGYFYLQEPNIAEDSRIVKAWRIKRKDYEYPYAYINDSNLNIISYNGGWIINK